MSETVKLLFKAFKRDQSKRVPCVSWTPKGGGQSLILPGNKRDTRRIAQDQIGLHWESLNSEDVICTNSYLKTLAEYES